MLAKISTILIINLHKIENYFYAIFCRKLLKESFLASTVFLILGRHGKNNTFAGKKSICEFQIGVNIFFVSCSIEPKNLLHS